MMAAMILTPRNPHIGDGRSLLKVREAKHERDMNCIANSAYLLANLHFGCLYTNSLLPFNFLLSFHNTHSTKV
jgi:hypothetical protein